VPTSYWAATPLPDRPCAVVFSTSFNPWLFEAHPVLALRQCFLGLLGTQVLAGVALTDVCLCDNFYTPHLEKGAHAWLAGMVRELGSLVEQFRTPVISGKDSSAGSTRTDEGVLSVPPAVFLSGLGKVPDVKTLLLNDWQAPGQVLVRIGPSCRSLAGTLAARTLALEANDVDVLDPAGYLRYLEALARLPRGLLASGVPIGPGGILGQAVQGVLGSGFGIDLEVPPGGLHELVEEHRCGALVEVAADGVRELPAALEPLLVGRLTERGPAITLAGRNILSAQAREVWRTTMEGSLR
jgi:phosphoribosylformylglycinamidine synthase